MTPLTPLERDALSMEYVLGVIDAAGRARVEHLIADDPVLGSRVAHWQQFFTELDITAPLMAPSPELWHRIEYSLHEAPAPATVTTRASHPPAGLWHNLALWRIASFASILAVAGLLAVLLLRTPSQPQMIAVLQTQDGKAGAVVESFSDGRVRLIPLQAIDVPQGRTLEIWTLRNQTEGLVSIGLLDRARTIKLDIGKTPPGTGQFFAISLEPAGGSPTGKPTGPVLMKGTAAGAL